MHFKFNLATLLALATVLPYAAGAAEKTADKVATQERSASDAEKKQVLDSIGRIGCKATLIEKEGANLFEVDDATCDIGKYDIKLDGQYAILSLTRD